MIAEATQEKPFDLFSDDEEMYRLRSFGQYLTIQNAATIANAIRAMLVGKSYVWVSTRGTDVGDRNYIPTVDVRVGQRLTPGKQTGDNQGVSLSYMRHVKRAGSEYGELVDVPQHEIDEWGLGCVERVHIGVADTYGYWGLWSSAWTQTDARDLNGKWHGDVPHIHFDIGTRFGKGLVIDQNAPVGDAIRWIISVEPEPFEHLKYDIPNVASPLEPLDIAIKLAEDAAEWNDPKGPTHLRLGDLNEDERRILDEAISKLKAARIRLKGISRGAFKQKTIRLGRDVFPELKDIPLFEGGE